MKAYSEGLSYLLRLHESDDAKPTDKYIASAMFTIDELYVATIKGFVMPGGFTAEASRAVMSCLALRGAHGLLYTRKKNGSSRTIRRDIVPSSEAIFYL